MKRKRKFKYPYCLREGKRLWYCPRCKHNHRVWMFWPQLVGCCGDDVFKLMLIRDED